MAHVSAAEAVGPARVPAAVVKQQASRDDRFMGAILALLGLYLVVTLALPLGIMLAKSVQDSKGAFVGLANYARYFGTPALALSITNSLFVALLSTAITVPLAFLYAYALTRSCLPWKPLFKTVALVPILVPSLLPGLALVYLFGNQGLVKGLLLGHSIYGPIGIVMAEVFFTFPHALLILATALSLADARLYEAAVALRASPRAHLLHGDAAGRALRADQRHVRGLHHGDHGLRRAQGHRRAVQRAGDRRLQAGDRPAELRDGRGGERAAAGAGGASRSWSTGSSSGARSPC